MCQINKVKYFRKVLSAICCLRSLSFKWERLEPFNNIESCKTFIENRLMLGIIKCFCAQIGKLKYSREVMSQRLYIV